MSSETPHDHEGKSPAAWIAVAVMLAGFAVGTIAFYFEVVWAVWLGVVIVALGLGAGFLLARAGYGVAGAKNSPDAHS